MDDHDEVDIHVTIFDELLRDISIVHYKSQSPHPIDAPGAMKVLQALSVAQMADCHLKILWITTEPIAIWAILIVSHVSAP